MSAFTLWIKPVVYYNQTSQADAAVSLRVFKLCKHEECADFLYDYGTQFDPKNTGSIEIWAFGKSLGWGKTYYPS